MLVVSLAACGDAGNLGDTAPEPVPSAARECTVTAVRFESTAEPRGHVGFCVVRTGGNVEYVACALFANESGRDPKEVEFHSADGDPSSTNVDRWETPECDMAAAEARSWLETRLGRR